MGRLTKHLKTIFCCGRADSSSDSLSLDSGSPIHAQPSSTALQQQQTTLPPSVEKVPAKEPAELTPFQQQARQIAQIPVAGMRRTTGLPGGYVTMYQTTQNGLTVGRPNPTPNNHYRNIYTSHQHQQQQQPKVMPSHSTMASTDTTIVGGGSDDDVSPEQDEKKHQMYYALPPLGSAPPQNKGTWQGKPNGTAYDRREELTEEDEDMWARMAM